MTNSLRQHTGGTASLVVGTTLENRYLVIRVIGSGGMSWVYQARDMRFPSVTRLAAVKEMLNPSKDEAIRQTAVQSFEREANLLATLNHPAIPRIYDYFTIGERSFLVMEFVNGKDLEAILTETNDFLPTSQVAHWGTELCNVIHYLHHHQPPVIFRDIKPSNIMSDEHENIRLVDFGIAKLFEPDRKGTMIGTEGYSPPEQYRGEAGPLSDVYALGATMHHLLSRRDPRIEPPFSWHDRPLRQINPSIPEGLEQVIMKALAYEPEQRFPDMKSFGAALAQYVEGGAPVYVPASASAVAAPGISAAAAPAPATDGIQPKWVFSCEDEIRGTPVIAKDMVLVGAYDNNLYALKPSGGEFVWKYAAEGGLTGKPAIFEDTIIVGSEDKRVHSVSLASGKVAWTYYTEAEVRSSPAIAEGHVFIGSDDAKLHAINVMYGRGAWKTEVDGPIRSTPLVSGDRIYFGCESGDCYSVDLRGEIKWKFHSKRSITSSPCEANNLLFVGSVDGLLYAVDIKSGWAVWRFRTNHAIISSPTIGQGLVIFGSADGRIYAVDSRSSKEKWHFETEGQVTANPLVHQGLVYCGSVDGHLYALELMSGKLRWKFLTGGPITGGITANDELIIFGSTDHKIYALPL
jgi:outer membrane protein assembly factor BamB/tRNA A-37 threonylcarbamoyl transferase component Bud32